MKLQQIITVGAAFVAGLAPLHSYSAVLPKFDCSAYAVTLAEDGESTQKYSVLMDVEDPSGMAVIISGPED